MWRLFSAASEIFDGGRQVIEIADLKYRNFAHALQRRRSSQFTLPTCTKSLSTHNNIELEENISNMDAPGAHDVRNVTTIGHVDHGKTTLMDALLAANNIISADGGKDTILGQ